MAEPPLPDEDLAQALQVELLMVEHGAARPALAALEKLAELAAQPRAAELLLAPAMLDRLFAALAERSVSRLPGWLAQLVDLPLGRRLGRAAGALLGQLGDGVAEPLRQLLDGPAVPAMAGLEGLKELALHLLEPHLRAGDAVRLIELSLRAQEPAGVRRLAANLLHTHRELLTLDYLGELMRDDRQPREVVDVLAGLAAQAGGPEAAALVAEWLVGAPDWLGPDRARALASMGGELMPELVARLGRGSRAVRRRVRDVLEANRSESVPALAEAVAANADQAVLDEACAVLGRLSPESLRSALAERQAAGRTLSRSLPPGAVERGLSRL